jgi:hypothetical protein
VGPPGGATPFAHGHVVHVASDAPLGHGLLSPFLSPALAGALR